MKRTEVLFTILNYKEKDNSERLYRMISSFFQCYILDADSGQRPESFNGDTLYLPNIYFGGLLNKAIELAKEENFTYLFFICSDVCIEENEFLKMKDILLNEEFENVAVYCPSHGAASYTFVQWAYNQQTDKRRIVPCIEAMISMWHKDVFNQLYPCADNKYGWGIDICAAYYAKSFRMKMLIDDRIQIVHPKGGTGKNAEASTCALNYISHHNAASEIREFWHWIYAYRLNKSANILLLKHYKLLCSVFYKSRKLFQPIGYKF